MLSRLNIDNRRAFSHPLWVKRSSLLACLLAPIACYEGASGQSGATEPSTAGGSAGATTDATSTAGSAATAAASDGAEATSSTAETSSTTEPPPIDPPACDPQFPADALALRFDGASHVRIAPSPHLGLTTFTLEAWVRRDGRGQLAGTGVGGLKMTPLITKGRGEADGDHTDVNYALGLFGDVLGADFEDMEAGANHPIYGRTPLQWGVWHHVAATYDGATWRLYLDGELDAEVATGATPRSDSIQPIGLGAAFNSKGEPAGALVGALDEVRIYARALTPAELRATKDSDEPALDGLVAHYPLDAAEPVVDRLGLADGTAQGALAVAPGALLDHGPAPRLRLPRALPGARDTWRLELDVDDPRLPDEGAPITVEFFARALTPADDFTVVALPDTQYYTRDASPPSRPEPDDPDYFRAQTRWAWQHRHERGVIGLITLGDIINNADQPAQWSRASAALGILEDFSDPAFPSGLPYAAAFGNHDQYPKDEPEQTDQANAHFGVDRFAGRAYYGGNYDGDNDENYVYFRAGELDLVVVSLQFHPSPDPALMTWVRRVFESHPRALGVVASHYIVTSSGGLSSQGKALHAALAGVPNVQIMASGHVNQDARRSDDYDGHTIHSMLSDFQRSEPDPQDPEKPIVVEQSKTNGGLGYMRIWSFAPSRQELYVETYSPKRDASYTDERNEFTLPVRLLGAGRGPFTALGSATASDGVAALEGLHVPEGAVLEWYAVARRCLHTTRTELQQIDRASP